MEIAKFTHLLASDFFVGVPDSQLKALGDFLMYKYGIDRAHHLIAVNEGNAVGIAAGYHLATGKIPTVYLQNSGLGNIVNPIASLLNEEVYGIPMIFVIGWRGEPNIKDEPQHIFQGKITLSLLEVLDISYEILDEKTSLEEMQTWMEKFKVQLQQGKQVGVVVRKNALTNATNMHYANNYKLSREEAIAEILDEAEKALLVSTTGKASREVFEMRKERGESNEKDFLTVGSMGHSSAIALGIALHAKDKKVYCLDGDGAMLMHMGSLALIGSLKPENFIHIILNNEAHESVGGMPTATKNIDFIAMAKDLGYDFCQSASTKDQLKQALRKAKDGGLSFIEVKCSITSRKDLGRPTSTPRENKESFMHYIQQKS